jgi:hypothetical protein
MDKNEILSDKEKYSENIQRLLNNCSSGDINQYIFEKNPEFLTIDFEKYKYLIAINVHKAYDFISLYILDQFIENDPNFTNSEKEEWQEELKDLSALNMDISGNIICRFQGIPQDSELAPYLLNYYMSRILEDPIIVKLLKDCEIIIYEDKIFIINNFDNEEMCRKLLVNLNNAFNKYNLSFEREYRIIKIGHFGFLNKSIKIDVLDNNQNIKISGTKFIFIEHSRKILNFYEIFFQLKHKIIQSYKIINIAKRYIMIKFNFYNSLLHTKYLKQVYKDWLIRELRNWLKANLNLIIFLSNLGSYANKFKLFHTPYSIQYISKELFGYIIVSHINGKIGLLKCDIIPLYNDCIFKNLENILKNQKITWKNNLCKIFCSFRIYFYYFYCPSIKKVTTKKLGIKK